MTSTNQAVRASEDVAAAVPVDPAAGVAPDSEEQIRVAAYFIYENNGCRQGHDLEDWVAAQAQLGMAVPDASGSPEATPKG